MSDKYFALRIGVLGAVAVCHLLGLWAQALPLILVTRFILVPLLPSQGNFYFILP
ncbi:hypothetical protein BDQ17DRAFT_1347799 [Cyathus striatus]|nr:hypothetical protein BDQ17DRAFT_1347799 [Cyathus striatus]